MNVHIGPMASKHLTTISLSEDKAEIFKEAAEHYGFMTLSAFFRSCGNALIDHYRSGDKLVSPLHFEKGWVRNVDHS